MRCDVIAEGIIAATKELDLKIPVVVRLQVIFFLFLINLFFLLIMTSNLTVTLQFFFSFASKFFPKNNKKKIAFLSF